MFNDIICNSEIERRYPSLIRELECNINEYINNNYKLKIFRICILMIPQNMLASKLTITQYKYISLIISHTNIFINKYTHYVGKLRSIVTNNNVNDDLLKQIDKELSELFAKCISVDDFDNYTELIEILDYLSK